MLLVIAAIAAMNAPSGNQAIETDATANWRATRACQQLLALQDLADYRRNQSDPATNPMGPARELLQKQKEPEGPVGNEWREIATSTLAAVEILVEERHNSANIEYQTIGQIFDAFCELTPE